MKRQETEIRKLSFFIFFFPIVSFFPLHFLLYVPIFLIFTLSSFSNIFLFSLHFLSFPFFFILNSHYLSIHLFLLQSIFVSFILTHFIWQTKLVNHQCFTWWECRTRWDRMGSNLIFYDFYKTLLVNTRCSFELIAYFHAWLVWLNVVTCCQPPPPDTNL